MHTTKKPIRTVEDFKGLRIRFAAPTDARFRRRAGRHAGRRAADRDQLEQLQKGTLDGVFIDYGGVGIAFKMGGTLKYSTEMYSYVIDLRPGDERGLLEPKLPAGPAKLLIDSR